MAHSEQYTKHIDEHSQEWLIARDKRLAVDDYCCAVCGRPMYCTSKGKLAMHHVAYANDLTDIRTFISVCGPCHGQLEGHLKPWRGQYNPNTDRARARLNAYIKASSDYIEGKTDLNNGWFLDYQQYERRL